MMRSTQKTLSKRKLDCPSLTILVKESLCKLATSRPAPYLALACSCSRLAAMAAPRARRYRARGSEHLRDGGSVGATTFKHSGVSHDNKRRSSSNLDHLRAIGLFFPMVWLWMRWEMRQSTFKPVGVHSSFLKKHGSRGAHTVEAFASWGPTQ